jgi:hypothetical protein
VPTQYTKSAQYTTKQRLIGAIIGGVGGTIGAIGSFGILCAVNKLSGLADYHLYPPSHAECDQIWEDAQVALESDRYNIHVMDLFKKLARCQSLYNLEGKLQSDLEESK